MTAKRQSVTITGFLLTFTGAILFSTKAIIVKQAFARTPVDPLSLLTVRMLFSLPFYLGTVMVTRKRTDNSPVSPKQWMAVIGLGLFGYYISSYLDFTGLQFVTAGLERLILFLYPTFVVLISAFVFREKITRLQILALILTYTGIAIAYAGELRVETPGPSFLYGSILVLICAITYAIYIAGSGKIIPVVGATRFTAYAMLSATGGILLHYVAAGNCQLLHSGTEYWGYGILLALLATVIPSFLISFGMKQIGSNNVAIISGIGPVSTIIQAHLILGEKIFAEQLAGTALVVAGVLLAGWKGRVGVPEKN